LETGRFPKEFFRSTEMQAFIGKTSNQRGHEFAQSVELVFVKSGFDAKLEVELTHFGAPKKLGLGDVDVIAWDCTSGRVYCVECKRLLPAGTVREVVQRLEEFRGDKHAKDSLGRHLRRIEWLNQNLSAVSKFTTIPVAVLNIIPLLVTSEIVPMQFYKQMNFPTEQVMPLSDLRKKFGLADES
jgi:hypothetical protein